MSNWIWNTADLNKDMSDLYILIVASPVSFTYAVSQIRDAVSSRNLWFVLLEL